jgi:dipeptide transport system substrate-binding protein
MQVIAKEDVPQYTIAHSVVFEPTRKEVVGYKISPFGRHEFYGLELK